jgi:membrane protein implicated in regulation of membrane protease activity
MNLLDLYAAHPFWVWLALGAILLAIEAGTGSGWLLWPAASAGVVALLALTGWKVGLPAELLVFALLTLVSTILARRFLKTASDTEPDINDQTQRLIGKTGRAVTAFENGQGRVLVANAEWAADLDGGATLKNGAPVVVTGIAGPRLVVQPS